MEINGNGSYGIDLLDDDDDDMITVNSENNEGEEGEQAPPPSQGLEEESDIMSDFLKTRGIDDASKIKFEDENGEIIERNWNDLTREELLNILNTPLELPRALLIEQPEDNGLSNEEIELINLIRDSQMSPQEYLDSLRGNNEPQYNIDSLSDDELYLLDLESRVGELSEDEGAQALAAAKLNEEFFNKQIAGIRKEYKEREDLQAQLALAEQEELEKEALEQYSREVIDVISNLNDLGSLQLNLDDNERNTLARFMLDVDESGNSYLSMALQDPETMTKAAWFILYGEEALSLVTEYYNKQIKLAADSQYKKGLEDGSSKSGSTKPTVVMKLKNNKKTNSQNNKMFVVDDYNSLDDDDED